MSQEVIFLREKQCLSPGPLQRETLPSDQLSLGWRSLLYRQRTMGPVTPWGKPIQKPVPRNPGWGTFATLGLETSSGHLEAALQITLILEA